MAEKQKPDAFRAKLSRDLNERYPEMLRMIDDAMQATRKVSVACQHCGRMTKADVPDVRNAIAAAEFITSHGAGRAPASDSGEAAERIIFRRVVVGERGDDEALERTCPGQARVGASERRRGVF